MAQVTLVGPDSHYEGPNTREESTERGWSWKKSLDTINEMLTELYASVAAAAVDAGVVHTTGDETITGAKTFADIEISAGGKIVPDWTSGAATAGAIAFNKMAGIVTSEALTTVAGGDYALTITNTLIDVNTIAMAALRTDGDNAAGTPRLVSVTPGVGELVIVVHNDHASAAFNGTLKIAFIAFPSA